MRITSLLAHKMVGIILVGLLFGTVYSQGPAERPSSGEANYDQLVSKVRQGDLSIDFKALRFAFAKRPDANTEAADIKIQAAMIKAYNDKNYKEAIKLADGIQKTRFIDMNSHVIASMAHQGLGDAKKAKFHEAVYLGLINSILNGADGNSTKTAYIVINPAEEYVLLNALELARGKRESIIEEGRTYDVHTATDKTTNQTVKIYFSTVAARGSEAAVPKN